MSKFIYLISFILFCINANSNNLLIYNFQNHIFYEGNINKDIAYIDKKRSFFLERSKKINDKLVFNSVLIYEQTNPIEGDFIFENFTFNFNTENNSSFKLKNENYFIETSFIQKQEIIDYINFPYLHSDKIIKPIFLVLSTDDSFESDNLFKNYILPFIFLFVLFILFSFFINFSYIFHKYLQ